jgi:FlaA1/EpsC-like NDP-sugar epimerase
MFCESANFVRNKTSMQVKKRILVTGASGFLGKALVETLLGQKGAEVIAVCHHAESCRFFASSLRLSTCVTDLASPGEVAALMSEWKPDTVFHLAAMARLHQGEQNPEEAVTVNLLGSIHLLQQAALHGTKRFLFTSSDLARDAQSVVGISKLLMERYLQLFSAALPAVITFRMPNLYDFPGSVMDIFARQIAENKDLSITDERMARRFITREEAVSYLLFLEKKGENHQVYSVKQEPVFIRDLALKMIADSGKDLRLKIIGARPGEKLYQASYSDAEAVDTGFRNLANVRLEPPSLEQVFACIRRLPVSNSLKAILQNRFTHLFS